MSSLIIINKTVYFSTMRVINAQKNVNAGKKATVKETHKNFLKVMTKNGKKREKTCFWKKYFTSGGRL